MATLLVNSATLLTQRTSINSAFIEINSLGVQVGSIDTRVGSLSTQVGSLSTQAASLGVQVGSLSTQVDSLSTQVGSISSEVNLLGTNVIRSLDLDQTGALVAGTVWGIDATAARSRALPSSPSGDDVIGFYVQSGGDPRNNNATFQVSSPDGVNGGVAGVDYVLKNDFSGALKYDESNSDWVVVSESKGTKGGKTTVDAIKVNTTSDTGGAIDAGDGVWQKVTLTANRDFTFDIKEGEYLYLVVSPGIYSLSYTNVDEWVGGAAPTSIGAEASFLLWSDNGTTITARYIGDIS